MYDAARHDSADAFRMLALTLACRRSAHTLTETKFFRHIFEAQSRKLMGNKDPEFPPDKKRAPVPQWSFLRFEMVSFV